MRALKKRLEATIARLVSNEKDDRSQSRRLDELERRMADAERKLEKRVKTLDAEE